MKFISYQLGATTVVNPDGSMPASISNCTVVDGPGNTVAGNFAKALDFGTNGKIKVVLDTEKIKTGRFVLRTVFKIDTAVTARQNLFESDCFPLSMYIDKGVGTSAFKLVTNVWPLGYGLSGASTEWKRDMKLGKWYTADLVYDTDTVAVFVDGVIVSVHAYPDGQIEKLYNKKQLFIGTSTDGIKYQFKGKMAAFEWYSNEIPAELETQVDEFRSHPEWFITRKHEEVKYDRNIDLGQISGKIKYDPPSDAYLQMYSGGYIMYNPGSGTAFEIHGEIFKYYLAMSDRSQLGQLLSDEVNTTKAGGRKSLFSKGAIYWSSVTKAIAVTNEIYASYEALGESSKLGWPLSTAVNITGGKEQTFQLGRMYWKEGSQRACEVRGAILTKFLALGGSGVCGFPVSDETDIKSGNLTVGKLSEFEKYAIYWKDGVGAFEVHDDILEKYRGEMCGPTGQLGFPTSDESNIPGGEPGSKCNTFENGTITWFNHASRMHVCLPFKFHLARISTKDSEGFGMGSNDIYFTAKVIENGQVIAEHKFGEVEDHNTREVNADIKKNNNVLIITPNNIHKVYRLTAVVKDADPGADDTLGTFESVEISVANAWGMMKGPDGSPFKGDGVFAEGPFSKIKNVEWSVQPYVILDKLETFEKWWGVENDGTDKIRWDQFAAAYSDVDTSPEWWDITDWIHKAMFEIYGEGFSSGGNCFGMCLEAINAYRNRSNFGIPLNRFIEWSRVENEFNIKHLYQAGSESIWWIAREVLSGNTHNPVDVFEDSKARFDRKQAPIMCISQDYFYLEHRHCVLPFHWNKVSADRWEISVFDPNFPSGAKGSANANSVIRKIIINPKKNEYTYTGFGGIDKNGNRIDIPYKGDRWAGSRMLFIPYHVVDHRQRSPAIEAVVALLIIGFLFFGSDAESVSLTDESGADLDAYGNDSLNLLKQNKPLDNKFVPVSRITALNGNMLVRTGAMNNRFERVKAGLYYREEIPFLLLEEVMKDNTLSKDFNTLASHAQYEQMKNRMVWSIVNDPKTMAAMSAKESTALKKIAVMDETVRNFKQQLRGKKDGQLKYSVKDRFNQVKIETAIKKGEINTIHCKNISTGGSVKFSSPVNKTVKMEIAGKWGMNNDFVSISIDKLPVAAGKDLEVRLGQGLSGLEILSSGAKTNATVTIQASMAGVNYDKKFKLDIEGGIRIRPAAALKGALHIAQIDNINGIGKNVQTIMSV